MLKCDFSGHSVYMYTEGMDVVSNFTAVQLPQNSTPCDRFSDASTFPRSHKTNRHLVVG